MNFFKSVFSDDPDPSNSESESESPKQAHPEPDSPPKQSGSNPNPTSSRWNFGTLIQTLATRSESVIETYRRDLEEFGTGLKKEIEVAQGSLGTVGHAIDEFGNSVLKGTAQIIAQGKEAILAADNESDSSSDTLNTQRSLNSKRYSRFDAQVRAVQGDINTYSEEPEDLEDYNRWRLGFVLEGKEEEIEGLLEENGEIKNIYKRVVPSSVDHGTFWCRYFYRVFKLKQAEDLRANLVKRAISRKEEEELSWDVDDDEDEEQEDERNVDPKANLKGVENRGSKDHNEIAKEEGEEDSKGDSSDDKLGTKKDSEQIETEKGKNVVEEPQVASSAVVEDKEEKMPDLKKEDEGSVAESNVNQMEKKDVVDKEDSVLNSAEKVAVGGKADNGESSNGKDSDFSVVSSQPSMPEEEDLGWDEIEDLSSIDDKKVTPDGSLSPKRADLRKRLSAAEEEEDLSWDIEDDDDPAKS
ncbi:hypothetical protein SLE2022_244520 [Rubroshorea leprosula]